MCAVSFDHCGDLCDCFGLCVLWDSRSVHLLEQPVFIFFLSCETPCGDLSICVVSGFMGMKRDDLHGIMG